MLSPEEAAFYHFWSMNREKQKTALRPLIVGLSGGLGMGILVILVLASGWYQRANMVANSWMSSVVLVLAIGIASAGMALLYRKFRWEMQEQRYLELKAKKKNIENQA
jgi:small-conductance mechanosensitive channel